MTGPSGTSAAGAGPRSRRRRGVVALLSGTMLSGLALAASPVAAPAAPAAPSDAPVITVHPRAIGARYLSSPPATGTSTAPAPAPTEETGDPEPPPTKGVVTGRVLTPDGKAYAGGLVQGVRFVDLGPGVDQEVEAPLVVRTDAQGRFRLPQLTEPYLVRVCDAGRAEVSCGSDLAPDRYATTYVGPDGVRDSWVRQTRMFSPARSARALPTFRMRPYARVSGAVRGVEPGRLVHVVRGNGSDARAVRVDGQGRYEARVAPGRYRVEVDRYPGLRTGSTVPGYRSRWLRLSADRPTTLSFGTAPAAGVTGLLTVEGEPVAERLVAITDARGRWAAGVVTDENGRFTVDALKPGRYEVRTLYFSSDEVPVSRRVEVRQGELTRADLETTAGSTVQLHLVDGNRTDPVAVEIRNGRGELTRAFAVEAGQRYRIPGFAAGRYQIVFRRGFDFRGPSEVELPWTQRLVTATGDGRIDLGEVALDQPTLRLSGSLPAGAQVKFATYPADEVYRSAFIDGPAATDLSQPLTALADARKRYVSVGWVPGRYAVVVSTALRTVTDEPSDIGSNVAVMHASLTFGTQDQARSYTAPAGGIVTARLRYAGTTRTLIAPVGYEVRDRGPRSPLFPTVSGPQTSGRGVRVDRLHAGRVTGRLLDIDALAAAADTESIRIPDSLLRSAPVAEPRTPYWLSARPRAATVEPGRTTRLGDVPVRVRS